MKLFGKCPVFVVSVLKYKPIGRPVKQSLVGRASSSAGELVGLSRLNRNGVEAERLSKFSCGRVGTVVSECHAHGKGSK